MPSTLPSGVCVWDATGAFRCTRTMDKTLAADDLFRRGPTKEGFISTATTAALRSMVGPRPAQKGDTFFGGAAAASYKRHEGFSNSDVPEEKQAEGFFSAGTQHRYTKHAEGFATWRAPSSDSATKVADKLKEGFCACDGSF